MIELGQDTAANLITVVVAVSTAIAANWSQVRNQTKQLKGMLRQVRKESHTDLEAIRVRVSVVERKLEGLLCSRREGDRLPSQSGGDPETGHLPPSSGEQSQS